MPFDFDKLTDRQNSYSLKWQIKNNELPMWVADMDFETAPEIINAIVNKAKKGIFGYTIVPDEYFNAICNWWSKRHQFSIDKEWIVYSSGVVPALSSIIRKLTTVGENVLIQPPVYNIFYNCIVNNGRHLTENKLLYQQGEYQIDFADLEQKLADPQTTLMLLCNPHNPIGKLWSKNTLQKIGELCAKYHVLIISDEIHCDLTHPDYHYTPFASVSEVCAQNSITCIAPTKTFNLAGLQTASVIIPNPVLRHKVNRGLNTDEIAEPNSFAIEATIAAFAQGESWLTELNHYIQKNKDLVATYIKANIPKITVVASDATYLLWLDCSAITDSTHQLSAFIRKKTGLYLSSGEAYGENGKTFLRMNVATSYLRVQEGLLRLKNGINEYTKRS